MGDFTDSEEKEYVRAIIALLGEYKADLLAAPEPYDPTTRIKGLVDGAEETDKADAAVTRAEQALEDAIAAANQKREANYRLAQATVGLIEGTLGKDSAAAEKARRIRSEITSRPRPKAANPATPPTA